VNLTRSRRSTALLLGLGLLFAAACSGGDDEATTSVAGTAGETSVGVAAPGGSPGGSAPNVPAAIEAASPGGALIRAAQATEAQSYRFEMDFALSGLTEMPGVSLNFGASGEADAENERVRIAMDLSSLLASFAYMGMTPDEQAEMDTLFADGTLEMIVSADTIYMRWPLIASMLGATTPWVSMDQALLGEEMMPATGAASFGYDPSTTLAFLESLEDSEEVGTAEIRGVATTQYHGFVTWESVLDQLPPEERAAMEAEMLASGAPAFPRMPIDVWVDADNLVRRYTMTMDLAQMAADMGEPTAGAGVFTFSYDLFDFGGPVVIDLPAASEVTPLTEEMMFGGVAPATY
jgi:hypothetical protein